MNSRERSRALGLVGELLVVFLGVAIALTGDAWWERQEEHARARSYMESLLADLDAAGPQLRVVIEANDVQQQDLQARLAALRSRATIPDSVELGGFFLGGDPRFPLGHSTALVETGDLRLIEDDDLRAILVTEYANVLRTIRIQEANFDRGAENVSRRLVLEEALRIELGLDGSQPIPLRAAQGSADMVGAFRVHGQVLLGNANLTRWLLESSERISAELTRVLSGAP